MDKVAVGSFDTPCIEYADASAKLCRYMYVRVPANFLFDVFRRVFEEWRVCSTTVSVWPIRACRTLSFGHTQAAAVGSSI